MPAAPPYLAGLPLLGSALDFQRDPLGWLSGLRDRQGDVVRTRIAGERIVVVSDPVLVEEMLVKKGATYTKETRSHAVFRDCFGNGLLAAEGEPWKRQRRIAQPAFHKERVAGFVATFAACADAAVDGAADDGAEFDAFAWLLRLTGRIAGQALFSRDVGGDNDVVGDALVELSRQVAVRILSPVVLPEPLPTPLNRRRRAARATLDAALTRLIVEHRAAGGARDDLLSMLIDAKDEDGGAGFDDGQLVDELLSLYVASHETSAVALAWILGLLAHHVDVQERLRANLDDAALLGAVIDEALRLYPPAWLVGRQCTKDDVLGGVVDVERGEVVVSSQWTLQRHPRWWPDPDAFRPARFLVDDPARPRCAFFPFLVGAHKCMGDQFARLELRVVVARLLKRLRFTASRPLPAPEPIVNLRPTGGLWLRAAAI